jgi:metal-dependent amidase/aminoacylase/carboxypeptidase family protein
MMMTKEELKAEALRNIDQSREEIIGLGEQIFSHPELGFKETNTPGSSGIRWRGWDFRTGKGWLDRRCGGISTAGIPGPG